MKKVKGVLFGDPGSGKSYFVNQFPKRFFICTDGNYEWLPNAKDIDHVQIDSWSKFKEINMKMDFSAYDCIVVDLLEDLFDWCKYETCKAAGVKHVSELGDYGKGYDIVYTNFLAEIFKLLAKDKSIFLICHGRDTTIKDSFGITHDYHTYTSFLPDKVIVPIEGRCRFFLRVFKETEIDPETKRQKTKHYLTFRPAADEFGINRGEYADDAPDKIPLDMKLFLELLGCYNEPKVEETASIDPGIINNIEMSQAEKPKRERKKRVEEPTEPAKVEVEETTAEPKPEIKDEGTKSAVDMMSSIFAKLGINDSAKPEPAQNLTEPVLKVEQPVKAVEPQTESASETVPETMSIEDIMKMIASNGGN